MKKFETDDYLWFYDGSLVQVESFANYQGTTRVEFVVNGGVYTVSDDNLEPVVHTYEDVDGDTWDLNLNDGLYYLRGGDTRIMSRGHERHELGQYGIPTPENMPEIGSYLKPKDAVYQVLGWDSSDNTAEVKDVETGQIHSILLEFYEEAKPPVPGIGEVWVATESLDSGEDGIAYLVSRVDKGSVTLTSSSGETAISANALRASPYWSRIF